MLTQQPVSVHADGALGPLIIEQVPDGRQHTRIRSSEASRPTYTPPAVTYMRSSFDHLWYRAAADAPFAPIEGSAA